MCTGHIATDVPGSVEVYPGVPGLCDRSESVPEITDKGTRVSDEVYSGVLGL